MGNSDTLHISRRPSCAGSGIPKPVRHGLAPFRRLLAVLILTGTLLQCGTASAVEKNSGVIIYTTLDHGRDETAIGVPFVKAEQFALVTNVTTPDGKSFRVTDNMLKEIVRPPDLSRLTVVDEAGLQSLKAKTQSLRALQKRFPRAAGALEGIAGEMERAAQVIESGNVLYEGRPIPKSDYDNRMTAAAPKTIELTLNGRTFSRARLTSVGDGKLSITHAGGVATINISDLDDGSIALLRESNPGLSIQRSIPCILGFSIPCDALLETGPDTVTIQVNGQTSLIATELIDLDKIPNTAEWHAPLREAVEARDRTIRTRFNETSPSPCVLTPYGSFLPLKKSHLVTSNGMRFAHSLRFATTPLQEFDRNPLVGKGGSAVTVLVYGNSSRLEEPHPDSDLEGSVSKELASMEKTQVLGYPLLHKKQVNPKIESEEFVFNNPDGMTSFRIRIENSADSSLRYDANGVVLEFLSSWTFDRHPAELVISNSDALLGPRDAVPEEWTVSLKDAETLTGLWFDENFDEKAWEQRELQAFEAGRIPLLTESINTLIGRYGDGVKVAPSMSGRKVTIRTTQPENKGYLMWFYAGWTIDDSDLLAILEVSSRLTGAKMLRGGNLKDGQAAATEEALEKALELLDAHGRIGWQKQSEDERGILWSDQAENFFCFLKKGRMVEGFGFQDPKIILIAGKSAVIELMAADWETDDL